MSVCTWTSSDIFLTEIGDGVFSMHVVQRKGLPLDGESFILDTQATLAKMQELVGMGYDIPDWAMGTMKEFLGEVHASKEGDTVTLIVPMDKAKWLIEALDEAVREANGWLQDLPDNDPEVPFFLDLTNAAIEIRAALIPLVEENVI